MWKEHFFCEKHILDGDFWIMKKYKTAKINFPKFKHILLHSKQNISKLICSWIWLCFKPQFSLPSAWPCFRPQSSLQMPWPYSRPQLSLHGIGLVSGHLFTKIEKYFFEIIYLKLILHLEKHIFSTTDVLCSTLLNIYFYMV